MEDKSKRTWLLDSDGQIGPGASVTITRKGRFMSLNNKNEIIYLVAPDGNTADSFSYGTYGRGYFDFNRTLGVKNTSKVGVKP